MNKNFIEVQCLPYGDTMLVNINTISAIHEQAHALILCGVHGEGNGLVTITKESMEHLLKVINDE